MGKHCISYYEIARDVECDCGGIESEELPAKHANGREYCLELFGNPFV